MSLGSMKAFTIAHVKDGQIVYERKTESSVFLERMNGKRVLIQEYPDKRTDNQNAFYWLYLRVISDETGDTSNDLHELFKRKFLTPKFITVLGKEIKIPGSTAKLSKADFGEYMERICAECGVPIPDPNLVPL